MRIRRLYYRPGPPAPEELVATIVLDDEGRVSIEYAGRTLSWLLDEVAGRDRLLSPEHGAAYFDGLPHAFARSRFFHIMDA